MKMDKLKEIKNHWENWSDSYGDDLRATTKSSNIKKLEIKAIKGYIDKHARKPLESLDVLEVGCGNGFNSIALLEEFKFNIEGFDFISGMVKSAISNAIYVSSNLKNKINFYQGDILNLNEDSKFDVVLSCRCLINLPTFELQKKAILNIIKSLKPNGILIFLENFSNTHSYQNDLRELVGLPRREVAGFNNFFEYNELLKFLSSTNSDVVDESNFSSLHDIMQYVVVPLMSDGKNDYDHEVMAAVSQLLLKLELGHDNKFGNYGQNKLLVVKKND